MPNARPFTDNFNLLIALITNLSLNPNLESRTPTELANELVFDPAAVKSVLQNFPCFFRQSRRLHSATKEHYFEVHARYAHRVAAAPGTSRLLTPPLRSEELASMFDLITGMVKNESELLDLQQRTEASLADLQLKTSDLQQRTEASLADLQLKTSDLQQRARTFRWQMFATLAAAIIAACATIASALIKGGT